VEAQVRLRPGFGDGLRREGGDGWCQHLHYDALMADPVGRSGTCTASFGEEVGPLHARRMEAFLDHRPQDAFGSHRYDPADFGWTYPDLAEEFEDYTERYHIRDGDGFPAIGTQAAQRFSDRRIASVPSNENLF
jgi:hypothetical protein